MTGEDEGLEERLSEELAEELPFVDAETEEGPDDLRAVLRQSVITGAAIFIPLAVTLLVVGVAVNFLSNSLDPLATGLGQLPGLEANTALKLLILLGIVVLIPVVGFVAEFSERGTRLGREFDDLMSAIPGVGPVYSSFNDMSELLLDPDTESFQDVKLVEYPGEGSYAVAFKTAETPRVVGEATGYGDMVTLFMPMAPNPVMGGFVIHVSPDRVVDVDMSVEQGIRSIVTSGVAFGEDTTGGTTDPAQGEPTAATPDELAGREADDRETTTIPPGESTRRSPENRQGGEDEGGRDG